MVAAVALPFSYAFLAWGTVMYVLAGVIYFQQLGWVVRHCPLAPRYRPAASRSLAGE